MSRIALRPSAPSPARRHRLRRALLAGALVAAPLLAAQPAGAEQILTPRDDPFYAAPENITDFANGDVIRSRRVHLRASELIKLPYDAYQVLYRTTDRSGDPIATVATIAKPQKRSANERRLLSYQTAYDGLSHQCRPSYSLRSGTVALQVAEALLINNALVRGWTVVTADYEGPADAWGVADTNARGVLDGIRAAERNSPWLTDGKDTKVGMVGYSGGGQATAWANEAAQVYAPELNIIGAAQGGLTADLEVAQKALDGQLLSGIGLAGLVGISNGYPELKMERDLNWLGRQTFRRLRTVTPCITDFALSYPFMRFRDMTRVRGLLKQEKYQQVQRDNRLGQHVPKSPTLWYQTHFDQMGGSYVNRQTAKYYCQNGSPLDFRLSTKEEHVMQAFTMPFKAQDWLNQRFNGVPVKDTCDRWG